MNVGWQLVKQKAEQASRYLMGGTGVRAGIFKLAVLWFSELLNWLDGGYEYYIARMECQVSIYFSSFLLFCNGVNLIRFLLTDIQVWL